MNFFRIWQKRIVGDFNPEFREVFDRPSPTWDASKGDGELIDDDSRHGGDAEKSRQAYEEGMAKAFARSLAALKDDGRMVVVFANKEVDAWQSLDWGTDPVWRDGHGQLADPDGNGQQGHPKASEPLNLCLDRVPKAGSGGQPGWEDPVLPKMRSILLDPREELGGKNILRYFLISMCAGPTSSGPRWGQPWRRTAHIRT